jgi:preprotein translocase subunit YajC
MLTEGDRVVIISSGVHGTVIGVVGTGDDTTVTIVLVGVQGDDNNTYTLTPAEVTAE